MRISDWSSYVCSSDLAELTFQQLWAVNNDNLPIGIHHASLSREARRKVEAAMAAGKLRGLVATASLDLGVDWGDVDCGIQMGAPKGGDRKSTRVNSSHECAARMPASA